MKARAPRFIFAREKFYAEEPMRLQNQRESDNVEDRRRQGSSMRGLPLRGLPIRGKTGVFLLVAVLAAAYFGYDLTPLLTGLGGMEPARVSAPAPASYDPDDQLGHFSKVALKTSEDTWDEIFNRAGQRYPHPKLVLYSDVTESACGYGQSAMGPFYCPADGKVYVDLAFYRDMQSKLGGGGDFALGYVIAHEVGHHVQNVLGITREVRDKQIGLSERDANKLSVALELQADCFAGVWGARMAREGILERGDLEEALNTASAIGDDRLQRQARGRVVPDSFTHGTSAQRVEWFRRGFESGDPGQCDTFGGTRRR